MNVPAFAVLRWLLRDDTNHLIQVATQPYRKSALRWQPLVEIRARLFLFKELRCPDDLPIVGGSAQNNPPFVFRMEHQATTLNNSNSKLKPVDAENYGGGIGHLAKVVPASR